MIRKIPQSPSKSDKLGESQKWYDGKGTTHFYTKQANSVRRVRILCFISSYVWKQLSELTSAEKSPFCRRMVLPPFAASISVGTWARMAKAGSMPTAVSTLLSITPIGGQTKPPTIRSIERCYFVNVILALTFMFFHNYALCEPYI